MEQEEVKKSKYNSAVSKEIRRSEVWKEANTHSRNGQFRKWNDDLDCIWRELCADTKNNFYAKETEFKEINQKIAKIGNIIDSKLGFSPMTKKEIEDRQKHYELLMEKDVWLRKLENELGKGTILEEDDEDSF
ncbi:MAG: hypothetical protein M0R17_05570 [Candidatus Omnitrophica bacterium]|jgi:hypothetical protein|nr:hypothetical protein [Candidatus Omnitrophota bacterium]